MKQKKFGKKIQNWHRPLRRSQLRQRFLRHRFVIDPTAQRENQTHTKFWYETVRWLIQHREEITDEESALILAWAMHEYTEAERTNQCAFSWKNGEFAQYSKKCIEYQRQLVAPYRSYSWESHGWDWELDEGPSGIWSFTELTSGVDLYHEGRAMHHCVTTYAARCTSGHCVIISFRHNGRRRITIEINPKKGIIVQARGKCNREASPRERSLIDLWHSTVVRPGNFQAERALVHTSKI